jgi:hypothetical protein
VLENLLKGWCVELNVEISFITVKLGTQMWQGTFWSRRYLDIQSYGLLPPIKGINTLRSQRATHLPHYPLLIFPFLSLQSKYPAKSPLQSQNCTSSSRQCGESTINKLVRSTRELNLRSSGRRPIYLAIGMRR